MGDKGPNGSTGPHIWNHGQRRTIDEPKKALAGNATAADAPLRPETLLAIARQVGWTIQKRLGTARQASGPRTSTQLAGPHTPPPTTPFDPDALRRRAHEKLEQALEELGLVDQLSITSSVLPDRGDDDRTVRDAPRLVVDPLHLPTSPAPAARSLTGSRESAACSKGKETPPGTVPGTENEHASNGGTTQGGGGRGTSLPPIEARREITVNIALLENGQPTMGVVHAPLLDLTYWGSQNQGAARCNAAGQVATLPLHEDHDEEERADDAEPAPTHGGELATNGPDRGPGLGRVVGPTVQTRTAPASPDVAEAQKAPPKSLVIDRTTSEDTITDALEDVLERDPHDFWTLRSSTPLALCRIAEGSARLYPSIRKVPLWRVAAGAAIVQAAGGQVDKLGEGPALPEGEDLEVEAFVASG